MDESRLQSIRIILVEPAGPLNIGSVARVMKNMGLQQLFLVQPRCDYRDPQARQMAVHGYPILEGAKVVDSLAEALVGCNRAIATTTRSRAEGPPLETPETALPWLLPEDFPPPSCALIFGPEDRGLSNAELNYAQRTVGIPTSADYASLNLAQAVAICCYLLRRHSQTLPPEVSDSTSKAVSKAVETMPASLDQVEGMLKQLESLLLEIEYLYPHTAASRMEKFRRLLHRSAATDQELAMLRGILRQVRWALGAHRG